MIERGSHQPRSVTIGRKQITLSGRAGTDGHEFTRPDRLGARVLDDEHLDQLSRLSMRIDHHFGDPLEIEWSIDGDGIHVIQVRPVTRGHHIVSPAVDRCVTGTGVGLGWATGRVRVVDRYEDAGELRDGEILVTSETEPEWQPHLARAGAVVTDLGDATSHAARTAVEFGIPAVVGAENATTMLDDGMYVTVDASRGWVLPTVTFAETL